MDRDICSKLFCNFNFKLFEIRKIWKIYFQSKIENLIRISCTERMDSWWNSPVIPPRQWHVEIQLLSISNHHRSWWTPMVTGLREPRKPISIFSLFLCLSTSTYRSKQRENYSAIHHRDIYIYILILLENRNFLLYLFFNKTMNNYFSSVYSFHLIEIIRVDGNK